MQLPYTVGKYELLELLRDETAAVYRARNIVSGESVTVTLLSTEASADPSVKARFLRDAGLAGAVDSGEDEGRAYVVMEPRTAPQPQARVPESPAGPILRLSIVVYALVILTTLLAIGVWMWTGHTFKSGESERVDSSHGPSSSQGMIYIPAGTFLAGPDKHPAMLNAFYIDATEVTAGEFCEIMHCPTPPASPNRPMVNVTVAQARQYAMREKKRLPTPLEWERAARGTNGNFYPWGDDADPALANVRDNPSLGGRNLVPAKSFQAYPEYQMAGNAWEMVEGRAEPGADDVAAFATLLQPPPTATEAWIAVRGGSFREPLMPDTLTKARLIPARYSAPDIGFRCVKDP